MKCFIYHIIFVLFCLSCSNSRSDSNVQNDQSNTKLINSFNSVDSIYPDIRAHINQNFSVLVGDTFQFSNRFTDYKKETSLADSCYIGYTDIFLEQQNICLLFNQKDADDIGLCAGLYICDYLRIGKNVAISKGLSPIPIKSLFCGFLPGGSGIRGYASTISNSVFSMYSYVYVLKYNVNKKEKINIYFPKIGSNSTELSDIIWKVGYKNKTEK